MKADKEQRTQEYSTSEEKVKSQKKYFKNLHPVFMPKGRSHKKTNR